MVNEALGQGQLAKFQKPELQDLPNSWLRRLVQDELAADDRQHLFQVCKGTATVVAGQADCIKLALSTDQEGHGSQEQQSARMAVVQTILDAAWETPLYVQLRSHTGHLPARWSVVPKNSVISLTVQGADLCRAMALPRPDFVLGTSLVPRAPPPALSLQDCQWMHTLILGPGCLWSTKGDVTALQEQRELWAPPSLVCLDIQAECNYQAACVMARLLGPQITHFYYGGVMQDSLLVGLAGHPKLSHITAHGVQPTFDHHAQLKLKDVLAVQAQQGNMGKQAGVPHYPAIMEKSEAQPPQKPVLRMASFKCDQLKLTAGANVEALMKLPLENIKRLVIRGTLQYDGVGAMSEQHTARVAFCPSLQCVPAEHDIKGCDMPVFAISGHVGTPVLNRCISSFTRASPYALYLCRCTHQSMSSLLPCIAHLPPAVAALGFHFKGDAPDQQQNSGQRAQFWCQLLTLVPAHVNRILLQAYDAKEANVRHCFDHASSLLAEMQLNPNTAVKKVSVVLHKEADPKGLLRALQRHYPGKLRLLRCGAAES